MYLSRWCRAQWPAWPYQQRDRERGGERVGGGSGVGAATVMSWPWAGGGAKCGEHWGARLGRGACASRRSVGREERGVQHGYGQQRYIRYKRYLRYKIRYIGTWISGHIGVWLLVPVHSGTERFRMRLYSSSSAVRPLTLSP